MNLIYNREISKKQHARGYMNEIMFSIDLGAEERLYDVKDFSISQFGKIAKDIRVCEKKRSFSKLKYDLISIFLTVIQTIGIYLFAIWQFGAGTLKIYDFLIYTSAALMMSGAIKQIFNTYTVLSTMSSYYDATERYMTQPDCSSLDGNMTMPESITDIVFENVTL